jgi:hypothetical protein
MRKSAVHRDFPFGNPVPTGTRHMEAERINQIGNQLADLSARTAALRGYL